MSDFTTLIHNAVPSDGDDRNLEHFLVITEGPERGQRVRLGETPVRIGRLDECELTLTDPSVSGFHCQVVRADGIVRVEDLGSTNGSFLAGRRISKSAMLPAGLTLRVGGTALRYECRTPEDREQLSDLQRAARYVEALLPAPRTDGPVEVDWCFNPSSHIGGDGFGYHDYDDDHLLVYLIDVSGHGVGSALHAVSILNVLRKQALPDVDFLAPAEVLVALNEKFDMRGHGGLFFTMWYGVFRREERMLDYASAGHPPALLRRSSGAVDRLQTKSLALGMSPAAPYGSASASVEEDSQLYLFSDGVFDIETTAGDRWSSEDFVNIVEESERNEGEAETDRLRRRVTECSADPTVDDFTLLVARFR